MKFARIIGLQLSAIGLILYCPLLMPWLVDNCGDVGKFGGVVIFAIGWSLLFADLVFNLVLQRAKEREKE